MAPVLRWGVVATGNIAGVVTGDLRRVAGVEVVAVSSRDLDRARAFAAQHRIPRAYGDYQELLADDDVDVVYVATPHSQHHAVTRNALLAGKHVLCEKAFTPSVAEAEELVELAGKCERFLMEAMWTRFNPLIRRLRQLVRAGAIGEIRGVHADFSTAFRYEPASRLWDPAQSGGVLYDLGVYLISFAHMLLGAPDGLEVQGSLAPNGVDAEAAMLLRYPGGAHALLNCSFRAATARAATVIGTAGRVELPERFYAPTTMTVVRDDSETHRIELYGAGYTYQIREVVDRITAGDLQSAEMPHDDSIAVIRSVCAARDLLAANGTRLSTMD